MTTAVPAVAGTAPRRVRPLALALLFLLGLAGLAAAADYPPLTGRVVDRAGIVPPALRQSLESRLADLEARSGIQLVVATVGSLDGEEIEPYANGLFRFWKLGEKTRNNGVLLLVAPNQRRVRIEVGYGLEGTLTDALAAVIIANAIAPRFKAGDYGDGIVRGVDDIITVLTTDASEWQKRPSLRLDKGGATEPPGWAFILIPAILVLLSIFSPTVRRLIGGGGPRSGGFGGGFSTSSGSSRSSGSSFSGGGGSSGGGGASGSW